jgi:adenosylhomocysteine nucleosidase
VGPNQALQVARVAISSFPVKVIISVGFASALHQDMKIGDLVVGESASFFNQDHPAFYPSDKRLLLLAGEVLENTNPAGSERVAGFKGPLLTVRRIIEHAAEKKTLASTTGAIALDMESAAIAGVAADARIAYLPVRAISDLVDENLGGISHFFSEKGAFRPFGGLLYLLFHPTDLIHMGRLRAHTTVASKRLGCFIHNYLHHLN